MKTLTSVMTITGYAAFLLCVGLTLNGPVSSVAQEAAMPSVASHEAAIQEHQDRTAVLEQKIQKLENRLDMVKNSYRDPKGFRSASWKRMVEAWRGELKDIREHIVWHEEQIRTSKAK